MSKGWQWFATLYLILGPCFWFVHLLQDQVQVIVFHLGTMALLALSLACPARRPFSNPVACLLFLCFLAANLWHDGLSRYGLAVLNGYAAFVAVWCLSTRAPSAEWVLLRVKWLAALNMAYLLVQLSGYDPLFRVYAPEGTANAGLFSRPNHLAILCLAAFPVFGLFGKTVLSSVLLFLNSLTGLIGILGAFALRRFGKRGVLVPLAALALLGLSPWVRATSAVPRLDAWKIVFAQALWAPVLGRGADSWAGAGEAVAPWTYNVFLGAFHSFGLLVLLPLLSGVWRIALSKESLARSCALLLVWAGLFHSLWDFPRLILLSIAVYSAWAIEQEVSCASEA